MSDEEFQEAKLLYELINKNPHAIDKDTLYKIIPHLGLSTKEKDLLARVDRLMRGMPMEDEFIALAVWMEKCKLIHKLEQEQFPHSSSNEYQVPDLFAVFNCDSKDVPVLIDVKVTHNVFPPSAKFRLAERLYKKLRNYAELVGLPLLIAWRLGGHWTLFDIREMKKRKSAYHIDGMQAMKADLMFLLLDNVLVTPKPGVSWTLILDDLGSTGKTSPAGEEHTFKFSGMHLLDANKKPITKMSYPQFILWMLSGEFSHPLKTREHWDAVINVLDQLLPPDDGGLGVEGEV